MTERLTEKIMVSKDGEILGCRIKPFHERQATQKLAEYETAEEEGRLVVLPCKVGDAVYKIIYQRDNFDDQPYSIITTVNFKYEMIDQIGKTVFLTREEAEKALKEMEGKHE